MTDQHQETATAAPRVPRLPEEQWETSGVGDILAAWRMPEGEQSYVPNPFATLARHPEMLRKWEPFAGTILLRGKLPHRDRELAVIRTALNCRASYVWGSHVIDHGPEVGLTDDDYERIISGPDDPGWSEFESALLRAADEIHADARISDATWSVLAASYTEEQLIELPMLIGEYHLMAFTFNSLGVAPEEGFPPLP